MKWLDELKWRGLFQDCSDEAAVAALPAGSTFYVGIDPSAPYPQIGNLVPAIVSMHLARAGLRPIILFGGATGSIGDPSGKSAERQLLDLSTVEKNVENQRRKLTEIFARQGVEVEFVNNMDWTRDVTVLEFLRDIGKHYTVNYMLAKDSVKSRLSGEGISFTEFSYMLLQGFDYYHLHTARGCKLQIGGADQWGNITAGLELIRRKAQGEAYAMTFPLLLNSQGKKFGKSEAGAVWLDAAGTSPYKFHQFWLNVDDKDVMQYLRVFTFHDRQHLDAVEESLRTSPEKREAQRLLADTMCTMIHGDKATEDAKRSAQVLFGGSIEGLSKEVLEDIFSEVPSSTHSADALKALGVLDLFVAAGLTPSKPETCPEWWRLHQQ
jgi:tyrosyl-tRNA synthetase